MRKQSRPRYRTLDGSDDSHHEDWLGAEAQVRYQGGHPWWRTLFGGRGQAASGLAWMLMFLAGIILGGSLTLLIERTQGKDRKRAQPEKE